MSQSRSRRTPRSRGTEKVRREGRGTAGRSSARSTVSGPARRPAPVRVADEPMKKLAATDALAAQMPFNPTKALEYGRHAARPEAGKTAKPSHPSATGSTLSEKNASLKVGKGAPPEGL